MKRIILLLVTLGICSWVGAQEHLKFKNIPIDGPEKAFVEALCQNEFHLVNDGDFGAALRGRFTGKTVDVFVIPTSEGITSRVAVNYPSPDNWGTLRLDFYTLLRSLSFKYGEPVEMSQEFQLPFSDGDGRELEALRRGRARWYARFVSPEGTIHLVIANNPMTQQPAINLFYEDAINCRRQDELNSQDL